MCGNHISLRGSEAEAFKDAADLVEQDVGEEDLSDSEIVEHLANAYRGLL